MAEKYKSSALNYVCQAVGPNGEMCCESKTLRIIDEIQQLHENRLKKLDAVPGPDGDKLRVVSLRSWVKDLSEQNALLVRTIEELEEEMGNRVRLLENKLQETSRATREYMTKAQDYKNDAMTVDHLRSDVNNLCKLIQQAQRNSDWTTDGLHFYEVSHEDIFGSEPLALQSSRNDNLDCQVPYDPLVKTHKPRKIKLSVEFAYNRTNQTPNIGCNDGLKDKQLKYEWKFDPQFDPCNCRPGH